MSNEEKKEINWFGLIWVILQFLCAYWGRENPIIVIICLSTGLYCLFLMLTKRV